MKANKTTIMILICAMCFLCVVSANVGNTSAYEAEEITSQTTAQVSDDYEFDGVERENEASQSEIIRNGSVTEERNFNEDGGGTIRVSFRAYWVDNKGVEQPLQRVKVVFKTYRVTFETGSVTTSTDQLGNASVSYPNTLSYINLKIMIYAGNDYAQVYKADGKTEYAYESDSRIFDGTYADFCFTINAIDDLGRAFWMSQALALGNNYINGIGGIGKCKLVFPSSQAGGGARYDRAAKTIHVKEYWFKWDTIIHEYGHHVACEKGIDASTGEDYDPSVNLIKDYAKGTAIRLSWSEAWAEAFSYLVFKSDYSDVWPDDYDAGYPVQAGPKFSETHILAITNILVSLSTQLWQSDFLKLVLESGATTLSSFVAKCYNDSRVNFTNLCKELEDNFISPQNLTTVINAGIPTYKWSGGEYPNNKFDLVFFSHGAEFYRITDIYSTEYTVTSGQWNYISTIGSNITCAVAGYHTGSPLTGGYISKSVPLPTNIHVHAYSIYQQYIATKHKVACSCGDYFLDNHNLIRVGQWWQCVCGYKTNMIIEPDSEYIVDSIGYYYIVDSLFNLGGLQYVMSNARRGEACV